jgi:hypothetical protein
LFFARHSHHHHGAGLRPSAFICATRRNCVLSPVVAERQQQNFLQIKALTIGPCSLSPEGDSRISAKIHKYLFLLNKYGWRGLCVNDAVSQLRMGAGVATRAPRPVVRRIPSMNASAVQPAGRLCRGWRSRCAR